MKRMKRRPELQQRLVMNLGWCILIAPVDREATWRVCESGMVVFENLDDVRRSLRQMHNPDLCVVTPCLWMRGKRDPDRPGVRLAKHVMPIYRHHLYPSQVANMNAATVECRDAEIRAQLVLDLW